MYQLIAYCRTSFNIPLNLLRDDSLTEMIQSLKSRQRGQIICQETNQIAGNHTLPLHNNQQKLLPEEYFMGLNYVVMIAFQKRYNTQPPSNDRT